MYYTNILPSCITVTEKTRKFLSAENKVIPKDIG